MAKIDSLELRSFDKLLEEAMSLAATSPSCNKRKTELAAIQDEVINLKQTIDNSINSRCITESAK